MKKTKKILKWIIGGGSLIYILIILFPQFIFTNKLEYKNFSVYYNSNEVSTEKLKSILNNAEQLLKSTELFENRITQDVFIYDNFSVFAFFAPLSRKAFAVNYPLTQNIFLSKSSISEDLIFRNGENNNQRTLSGVIAHETTHSLLENKLGTIKYKIFPSWKNEGYCDFIANESSYDEQEGLSWICNKKENSNNPSFKYFKYRLITDYLFKERKISMEEFLTKKFDLDELNEDIKEKYCTQQGVKMH